MNRFIGCRTIFVLAVLSCGSTLHRIGPLSAQDTVNPFAEAVADADLSDVMFVDSERGWAVGDRGAIWHTSDGGATWKLQASPVSCRLESIFFLNRQLGWTVGGIVHPYTHHTTAVLLQTKDGGQNWTPLTASMLPWLKRIQFRDERRGWAIGKSSNTFPTGVFLTNDGGRSWAPVSGATAHGWLAGDLFDPQSGVVVGHEGNVGLVEGRNLRRPDRYQISQSSLRDLVDAGRGGIFVVGDGGVVQRSDDRGQTWQNLSSRLPASVRDFDFATIAQRRSHLWIAGSPGSIVLHSADYGDTWEAVRTGHSLPIHRLCFVDDRHGWGVGALGTILSTSDGGNQWKIVRGDGRQLAVLGLYSELGQVPLELFSDACGNQGYLGYVELLNRRDSELPDFHEMSVEESAQSALLQVGACGARTASRFPLRQSGLDLSKEATLAAWSNLWQGDGETALQAAVVRRIRQWRPLVVVTDDFSARTASSNSQWMGPILQAAVAKAGDPLAFPEQLHEQGLSVWKVQRLAVGSVGNSRGAIVVSGSTIAARMGRVLSDVATSGRSLWQTDYVPGPASWEFRVMADQSPNETGRRDLFGGLFQANGMSSKRFLPPVATDDLAKLNRITQRQKNVQRLLAHAIGGEKGPAWLAQLDDLTQGLDAQAAGEVLFQLGDRFHHSGRPQLALEVMERFTQRDRTHELSAAALLWQMRLATSGEVRTRIANGAPDQPVPVQPLVRPGTNFVAPSARTARTRQVATPENLAIQQQQILKLVETMQQSQPQLTSRPDVKMMLISADRNAGRTREADASLRAMASSSPLGWERVIESELLQVGRGGSELPANISCRRTMVRPRLDGHLDDEAWEGSRPTALRSRLYDDDAWPAQVMLMHDDDFLYVSATCTKCAAANYVKSDTTRPRDPHLDDQDRLELLIDIDRDYSTFYRLIVDYRGWSAESCLADSTWNPEWYVAANEDGDSWTVEAAISKRDLIYDPGNTRNIWAIGLQRVVPGVGFQSWTAGSAIVPRPESFGFLTLE